MNPYVKVSVIKTEADFKSMISSGTLHVVCQTEMILGGHVVDQETLNNECRAKKIGYISTQTLGPWGYGFVDFGDEHTVTDHDGE